MNSLVFPRFITYFVKVIWQAWFLASALFWISKPKFVLVQNPPSIPSLPVCWFVTKIRRIHLIVDWHNYGIYSSQPFPKGFFNNLCVNNGPIF